MKLSFLALFAFAAGTTVAAPTESTKDHYVPFNNRDLGPLKPNPFQGLKYGDGWQVGKVSVQASNIKAQKNDKTLFLPFSNITDTSARGKISVDGSDNTFIGKSVKVGCSVKKGDSRTKKTLPCDISIKGSSLSGSKEVSVEYTKTNALQSVDISDLQYVDSLFFRVSSAGKNKDVIENVTLLVDEIRYTIESD